MMDTDFSENIDTEMTSTPLGLEEIGTDLEPTRKRGRKTSSVWDHFEEVEKKNDDGTVMKNDKGLVVYKAVCKVCNEDFVCGGRSGTNHLRRHASVCGKNLHSEASQQIIGRTENGAIFSFIFSQKRARQETARYFVQEELALHKVEKPAFRRWVFNTFGPQFKPPCRNTLKSDIMLCFLQEKTVLKEILSSVSGVICLTSDLWSSNQKLGYMCVTAHWISDGWKLNKRIISFPMLPSPHTGFVISEAIYTNLLGWNISEKIGTLTLDNASNNDGAVARLKDSCFGNDRLRKELFHIQCNAHVTNLLVKDGLKHVEYAIENIIESILHVKSSSSKLQKFFKFCQELNMKEKRLPMDVGTRWDSTYLMLNASIPYKKVFELFFYDSEFPNVPSAIDWSNAIVMQDFLKIFLETTKLFSGRKYVTSSTFCYQLSKIACLLNKYAELPGFEIMIASMKLKYDKYWKDVPLVLGLASCMDPRFKMTILELCLELNYPDVYPQITPLQPHQPTLSELKLLEFKKKLSELFSDYQEKCNGSGNSNTEIAPASSSGDDMVFALLSRRREISNQTCKSDLQRYLDQPTVNVSKDETFDILQWWQTQEDTYPVLSKMARDLLTIPVSTVASESAFSGSERVLSKYRSRLLPETVEALVCLKDWYDADEGSPHDSTQKIEELMGDMEL